jgi:hypothetical protein
MTGVVAPAATAIPPELAAQPSHLAQIHQALLAQAAS